MATVVVLAAGGDTAGADATDAQGPVRSPAEAPTASAPVKLKYETPTGWTDQGAKGERKASFTVVDGDRSIDISVTSFPASAAQIANPISNINRWRGQLGLAEASAEEIARDAQQITIGGKAGVYVEIFAPNVDNAERATLAAMFRADDDVWFMKLTGDAAIAKQQRDAFKKFLESVSLDSNSLDADRPDADRPEANSPDSNSPDSAAKEPQGATDGK
jgi:hypothetical protein